MKVNPIGIQTYQQMTRRDRPEDSGSGQATTALQGTGPSHVTIQPDPLQIGSKLAVKAASESYAESLSVEERQALELLFNRFRDSSRFGPAYRAENQTQDSALVGQLVDVKV